MELPFAEDVGHYWKTGRSSPDEWIMRARHQIEEIGGEVLAEAFGSDGSGRSVYMLGFTITGDKFKLIWPVLPSKTENVHAAKIQAATLLYHDVKARCMTAKVLGARSAFFSYVMLDNGRMAQEVSTPELWQQVPKMLAAHDNAD